MSIPTTETKPDGIYRAPKPKVRYVREMVYNANPRELRAFSDNLIKRSQVEPRYFAQLGLGLLLFLVSILAKLPLLVLIAAITAPVLNPIFGLVAAGVRPSGKHMFKSFLYLVATILLFFSLGWLVEYFNNNAQEGIAALQTFTSNSGWLEWLILVVLAILSVFLFLYRENIPSVLSSAVLVYLIFIPVSMAGMLYAQGSLQPTIESLLLAGSRLFIFLIVMIVTIWASGLKPKQFAGWFLFGIAVISCLLLVNELRGLNQVSVRQLRQPAVALAAAIPTNEISPVPTRQPTATISAALIPSQSPTAEPTATDYPKPTQPTITEEPVPAINLAQVVSESGVVVRESPDTSALILAYLNNGQLVTLLGEQENAQTILWEKVELADGTVGWATSKYLQIIED